MVVCLELRCRNNSLRTQAAFTWCDAQIEATHYATIALAELAGIREADVLLVLLPGGCGTHVEIGAALALGKPVIIHAPDRATLRRHTRACFIATQTSSFLFLRPSMLMPYLRRWPTGHAHNGRSSLGTLDKQKQERTVAWDVLKAARNT
jgi:nucleoside 2-deoxyribosyltransferase